MVPVDAVRLVAEKGILGDLRYFERISRKTGKPTRDQVSAIERELLDSHAATLAIDPIAQGLVRSNIETEGIDLSSLIGREIEIGEALLIVHSYRKPCAKMDAIKPGLRKLMEDGRQGVLAEVVRSGRIKVGDVIYPRGCWDAG
jgi:MOSC domain-containing protein YiiM